MLIVFCSLLLIFGASTVYCPVNPKPEFEKLFIDPISLSEKLGQNIIVGIPYKVLDESSEAILRN